MNKKSVTLKDVAMKCGVSVATVSYVLNGKTTSLKISESSIKRVLEESMRMNYRPDRAALELEKLKWKKLSILMYSPWLLSQYSDFMFQVNQVLNSALQREQIKVDSQFYSTGQLKKILKPYKCEKYDIVLIMGTNSEDEIFLEKKCSQFKNIILLHRNNKNFIHSCGNDGEICMEMANRLLAKNQYDKYVLVYNRAYSGKEAERIAGYRKGFAQHNNFEESVHDLSDVNFPDDLLEKYSGEKVCFIFTMYINAARMLRNTVLKKISVPDQVGIVAYDRHTMLDNFLSPALTTIDPDYRAMTEKVLELGKSIKDGNEAFSHITKAKIIEGGTAGI